MALTSWRDVASGFYRVHLWVLLGITSFGAVVLFTAGGSDHGAAFALACAAAALSYLGAVIWLYEKPRAGVVALLLLAVASLAAAACLHRWGASPGGAAIAVAALDIVTAGFLVGATMAAMLLGHYYLNSPGMKLAPIKKLVVLIGASVVLRAAVAGAGLGLNLAEGLEPGKIAGVLTLRWAAGIVSLAVIAWMTWKTLQVPNTQSATGILYAGVILVFLGELISLGLSADLPYPL